MMLHSKTLCVNELGVYPKSNGKVLEPPLWDLDPVAMHWVCPLNTWVIFVSRVPDDEGLVLLV